VVAATVEVRQPHVVQAHQVHHSRVQVRDVKSVFHSVEAELIGYPDRLAAADTIDPRISGLQLWAVQGFGNSPVLVLRVPKSYLASHMVKTGDSTLPS
jgi:hypothetical protein